MFKTIIDYSTETDTFINKVKTNIALLQNRQLVIGQKVQSNYETRLAKYNEEILSIKQFQQMCSRINLDEIK